MSSTPAAHAVTSRPESLSADRLRRALGAILLFGLVGTGAELVLLEHTEDPWQLVPLALVAAAVAIVGWHVARGPRTGPAAVRLLAGLMVLFVIAGGLGVALHYRGNVEFELERDPTLSGARLVGAALMGATPALAPGTMALLGFLGLAYAYGHPALSAPHAPAPHDETIS